MEKRKRKKKRKRRKEEEDHTANMIEIFLLKRRKEMAPLSTKPCI